MRITLINTNDFGGGAEMVARNLHLRLPSFGIHSDFVVRTRVGNDPNVWQLQAHKQAILQQVLSSVFSRLPFGSKAVKIANQIQNIRPFIDQTLGNEPMHFPASRRFLDLLNEKPDLIHAHNLHGNYFDLRYLSELSQKFPVLITMHDHWLTTGHCASPVDCDRWKIGCGECPDLSLYPSLHRDRTRYNLRRKARIYAQSKLHIAVPSRHLADAVKQSVLGPAVTDIRVVQNGIDLSLFSPASEDKRKIRNRLGIPEDGPVLLTIANSIRTNKFKDFRMVAEATRLIAQKYPQLITVVVGSRSEEPEQEKNFLFAQYSDDQGKISDYYRAADIFLHAAKKEAWGLTATEAMACGIPVVATGIEGLLEQIRGLECPESPLGRWGHEEATGVLVSSGDAEGMADACLRLISNENVRQKLGQNATRHAQNFSIENQVSNYVDYYKDIVGRSIARPQDNQSIAAKRT